MATTAFGHFTRLVRALVKKNLILLVTRHWLSTLLQAIVAPVVISALLLNIGNYSPTSKTYGQGDPAPIRSIKDSIPQSQQLVFIKPPGLGHDVDTVIETVSAPLPAGKVVTFASREEASSLCRTNFRGVSSCYAIVHFIDSRGTASVNKTWNYTIQWDRARMGGLDNVHVNTNNVQLFQLPVMLAVDNAITNSTEVPDEYMYTQETQEEVDRLYHVYFNRILIASYTIVFFLATLPSVYHTVSFVTGERADGISQLIDAMGGSPAARVLSSVISLSTVQFPAWIVIGCLYRLFIFFNSNAAILIFWQIFSGMSFIATGVFAAAFFQSRKISSVFVVVCFCCLAGGATILFNRAQGTLGTPDRIDVKVAFLSALFPAINYIYTLTQMGRYAMFTLPIDLVNRPPTVKIDDYVPPELFFIPVIALWAMLIGQIIVYTLLAIVAEKRIHGLNFKGRTLSKTDTAGSTTPTAAIRVVNLTKVYATTWYKRIFRINDGTGLRAIDNVDLVAEKNQVLCLLGVNGAGKSTLLDLLSGFHTPASGEMFINARPSQLGICPQKNVLFDRLTVLEHVKFWSEMKGGSEDLQALHALIEACDLTKKTNCKARTLSGGQKRKLQLACMFVGGASVCLMDEVTTGLDPISRRTIWNIILAERAKRSMVFTTHFLDEGEVLGDYIVILSKGRIKCQGSGAELKSRFGGGYRVYVPKEADIDIDSEKVIHQDRVVYRTPDSSSAAQLVARIEAAGGSNIRIAGPTIEDVFLRVAEDEVIESADLDGSDRDDVKATLGEKLSSGRGTPFFKQVRILMMKRVRILPRYWIGALLALALPIACMPPINALIDLKFERPTCTAGSSDISGDSAQDLYAAPIVLDDYYLGDEYVSAFSEYIPMPYGPFSAGQTLYDVLGFFPIGEGHDGKRYNVSRFKSNWAGQPTYDSFRRAADTATLRKDGIWFGDSSHRATIAHKAGRTYDLMAYLRTYTSVRSRVPIASAWVQDYSSYGSLTASDGGWTYILYAAFIFTVYPAFFALYPAFERTSKVRALQRSNGVRPLPIWTAYFLFDLCFVVAVSIAYTVTITRQFPYWAGPSYMFAICFFHGIAGILTAYIVSTWAASQLSSFLWTLGLSAVAYFGLALSYTLPTFLVDPLDIQRTTDILSYVLGLLFPIGNVFRGMAVGLNLYRISCRDEGIMAPPGSWWGYGFPITYLCIQVVVLAALLVWLDSDLKFSMLIPRRRVPLTPGETTPVHSTTLGVEKEAARVVDAPDDLLRMVHVSKSFKTNLAVDDVSLGLGQNEILALLGPNGAGKTTCVELIRGELQPDSGRIFLRDMDVTGQTQQLTRSIGVCPQFDALDLLTARQHLEFYARIKGVYSKEVRANAEMLMARVGLTPHADKQASKLSGGNRRKLSLAIAVMGDPDVLILDEPSSAMDAAAKRKMWKVLAEDIAPGRSVLLTTHSMEEADALATRAAILSKKLLAIGTTQSLRERFSNLYQVELVLGTAPHSTRDEIVFVEGWVREQFPDATFEGVNIGGQVKFRVPVCTSAAPATSAGDGYPAAGDLGMRTRREGVGREKGSYVGDIIALLEKSKVQLGVQDYSIGAPTLERVFLSVVRENYVDEEEMRKPAWRRFLGLS
ncbi:putative ABC transporter [Echria macrotheca]|uniref:ABC transporter n=1 Tax=Echria macrotheca TaxID=438768 RepID=A0AAJ0BBC7_9PEZI|nr:putative ABC transporter [Echria macrotheca]